MRYLILLLALAPMAAMMAVYLHVHHMDWFDSVLAWLENAFHFQTAEPKNMAYFLSRMAGISSLWLLIFAFFIHPMYVFLRFDLREFKKLLGGFAVFYGVLHFLLFIAAHDFAFGSVGRLFTSHLFLGAGMAALLLLSISPLIKSWYKLLYIAVVLVMIHLMLGYNILKQEYILALSLLALGLALRLVKR